MADTLYRDAPFLVRLAHRELRAFDRRPTGRITGNAREDCEKTYPDLGGGGFPGTGEAQERHRDGARTPGKVASFHGKTKEILAVGGAFGKRAFSPSASPSRDAPHEESVSIPGCRR
jgi:hypothetical protein